ncbi:hypothetical protein BGZ83_001703, partial [Gryganskiella cystojenkinii]
FAATAIALILAATSAQACVQTCFYKSADSTNCYYTCTQACDSITAHEAAGNFLGALQAKSYNCDYNGVDGVKCAKNSPGFGACSGHKWNCGKGC